MAKKKAAAKKKVAAKKPASKKAAPKKKVANKKAAAKKAEPKKNVAAKKKATKKAAPKKAAPKKKVAAKKAAPKKKATAVKKVAAKKKATKKAAPKKKAASNKTEAKKASVQKAPAKKAPAKKKAPEKTVSRRAVVIEQKAKVKKPPRSIRESSKKFTPSAPTNIKTIKNTSGKVLGHRATHELNKLTTQTAATAPKKARTSILGGGAASGAFKRYNDQELENFRKAIAEKLEKAKTELKYLQGLITRKDSSGTDDTENRYASMEDGSMSNEREQLNQMASRQTKFINNLEKALIRIRNKTYGVCRETGELISKKRLMAVPHATLSKEAKDARR